MKNRINDLWKKGEGMDEIKINEITDLLKNAEGYMVGVTLLKEGELKHYLLTNKFPQVDMLKSIAHLKNLVIEDLEK